MKFKIGTINEHVMKGVSELDRSCLGRMWFWVKDDLDSSRIVGVHENDVDF